MRRTKTAWYPDDIPNGGDTLSFEIKCQVKFFPFGKYRDVCKVGKVSKISGARKRSEVGDKFGRKN
jgi:hypothetical protein